MDLLLLLLLYKVGFDTHLAKSNKQLRNLVPPIGCVFVCQN